ncbi:MBL fold metallo-hydrolase [Psychromicrobium sp. YIM B11713]|uniref:MBL fold metallo-hydrolase n=1 Tax=Psychromicrobium sp. YIM B11713 TaxID=3145233 RepID=UPI00374FBE3D
MDTSLILCESCGVEHSTEALTAGDCRICRDDRQYLPPSGQSWITLGELLERDQRLGFREVHPGLWEIQPEPRLGIGQHSILLRTSSGNLLWDPPASIDPASIARVQELGGIAVIASSHPHMFGLQLEWSAAFSDAPVYVAAADQRWLQRTGPAIQLWSERLQLLPEVSLLQTGGHFPGSAVAHWAAGEGVLLTGDTIFPVPSGWVSFMRSYPNYLPLSPAIVRRVAARVSTLEFDRIHGNFGNVIPRNAKAVINESAERYAAWASGENDQLC